MLVRTVFGSLMMTLIINEVLSDWHADFGPWVTSTKGEPWPLPLERNTYHKFRLIRPENLRYQFNHSHPVLAKAVDRYHSIIVRDGEIGYQSVKYHNLSDDDVNYLGEIDTIVFNVPIVEETHPYLHMNENYSLIVDDSNQIKINAGSVWGALRALETFSQILTHSGKKNTNMVVKVQTIYDAPKLSHRGLLLDTSRHYIPVSDILLTLDAMAYNKLNVFHWHIVDDNSFPYKGKKYPGLAEKGAWHPEMLYTTSDVQNIIEYARVRGIRTIAEFDTPGHTRSWGEFIPEILTKCYDELGKPNGKLGPMNPISSTIWPFLDDFFGEVFELFYDSFIHLGGDEVPFDCWESNPDIVKYMEENNMRNNFKKLENEFIRGLLNITESHEKNAVVWHEVYDNGVVLSPNTTVHVWTGEWQKKLRKITKNGLPVLLSACWYLDHVGSGGDWEKYYTCDPLDFKGSDEVRHLMLGGEACMWGEAVDRTNVHQRIWPRASAAAESLWSYPTETVEVAAHRLEEHACRMNRRNIPAQPPNGPGVCYV